MCQALHIECSNLQPSAAMEVAVRLCWYSWPLAFESGSFTSDYLQAGVALFVLAFVSVGVRVYSGSADKIAWWAQKHSTTPLLRRECHLWFHCLLAMRECTEILLVIGFLCLMAYQCSWVIYSQSHPCMNSSDTIQPTTGRIREVHAFLKLTLRPQSNTLAMTPQGPLPFCWGENILS